jgi:hypothetical protein
MYRGRTFDENVRQGTAALNGRKPRVETLASDQRRQRRIMWRASRSRLLADPPPTMNVAAFSTWEPGTSGNFGRNGLRASGISQRDLGLARDVSISERVKVCFRANAFNVFNRAQYAARNAKLSQVNFGKITTTISYYARGRGTPRETKRSATFSF